MNFYLKLWLLMGLLLTVGHCQEEGEEGEMPEGDEGEEGPYEDAADVPAEDGEGEEGEMPAEEGEEGDGAENEGEDTPTPTEAISSEQMHMLFKKMDADKNDKLTLAEIEEFAQVTRRAMDVKMLNEMMTEMDLNKDGKLTLAEYLAPDQGENEDESKADFTKADTNADAHLDADELAQHYKYQTNAKVETMLAMVAMKEKDKDKDGKLSLVEWTHVDPADAPEEGDELPAGENKTAAFPKLDTDGSGSLTLTELKAWESGAFQAENAVRALFTIADKDKDKMVTIEELDAAQEDAAEHESDAHTYLGLWHDHYLDGDENEL